MWLTASDEARYSTVAMQESSYVTSTKEAAIRAYQHYKPRNLARVTISGKDHNEVRVKKYHGS